MSDPITIGTLAAAALATAADAALKGTVGEGVKDAYKSLKDKVVHWARNDDIDALEKSPGSVARRAVLAEVIDGCSSADLEIVKKLAMALIAALKGNGRPVGLGPVGLDIEYLQAMSIQLEAIIVTEGTGVRGKDVRAGKTFKTGPIMVGNHQQKK